MGETLNVFGGEQWRPLLHVKDVANAVIFSLKNDLKGLYNLSYNNYQIKEIANEIKEIIPKTEIHYSEKQFEDLRNYKVNTDSIIKTGFNSFRDLKTGVKEIEELFLNSRIKKPEDMIYSNADYIKTKIHKQSIGMIYN